MTTGTVKTQGTHLYFINPLPTDPTLVKMACPTGITGLGGAKDQIPSDCLDTVGDHEFVAGLGNPGAVSVPFNLIPRDVSHQDLFTLKERGDVLKWMVCLSESDTAPTIATDGTIDPATDRTCLAFDAYIADVNLDMATNEIVRGTLSLQRSGVVTPYWFDPTAVTA
jgi:hypothetical protein